MISIISLAVYSLVFLQALVDGLPVAHNDVPRYFQTNSITRRNLTASTVERELGPLLSTGSLIFGPTNAAFANVTERWATYVQPNIEVVVEVAAESDISTVVKYCNDNSIEFLARNRGHGLTLSLDSFKGLQITLNQLQGVSIQEGGKFALLQAGTYAGPVIQTLWDQGYVTSTGSAYCVGVLGLGLGGGHGRLEGIYGLVADGFVHLNVVLADGSEIGVNATSHKDLYWAMKGAGHNFGIVTSVLVKLYPKPATTWHYHAYVWTQDKLEVVFEELNKLHVSDNGTLPPLMSVETGAITMDTSISETEPILTWSFAYNGPAEDAEKLLEPFNAIGAVAEEVSDVEYPEIAQLAGTGLTNATCTSGPYVYSHNMLLAYNITMERQLYDQFIQYLSDYPDLAITARFLHEGYSNAAVQAVPYESTAYPHRDQNIIIYFLTAVESSNLLEPAETWAQEAFDLLTDGQKPQTYVNYASSASYESLGSVYGYEAWRLERLYQLKGKYDPHNRFRFYEPIVSSSK